MKGQHYNNGYRDGLRDIYNPPFPDTPWRIENRQYCNGFADAKDSLIPNSHFEVTKC
jgi:hypothetical protein